MDNLLKTYDKDVRTNPIYPAILQVVKENILVKLAGPEFFKFISCWDIPEDHCLGLVGCYLNKDEYI